MAEAPERPRGQGPFRPEDGFGPDYKRFFDLDLGQSLEWLDHGGERLAMQRFEPGPDVQGSALLVHGYYDHVGLYGHAIRYLQSRGLRVFAYDQQGHGLSTGRRATIDSFDRYVDALDAFIDRQAPDMTGPRWLIGQSMGASVILELLDTRSNGRAFDHVALLAPLVRPASWALGRITYALGRHFLTELERKFAPNTENPEFSALLRCDPLQARTLPVEWVTAMVEWMRRFEARRTPGRPIHVVQGGRDRTVDGRANVKLLQRRFAVTLEAMPEARHHLVNEHSGIRSGIWRFLDSVGGAR